MSNTEQQVAHAQRRARIVAAARDLAEAEGWSAVTMRRVAEQVKASQPVVHSSFSSTVEIIRAVALEGFHDLTAAIREARARLRLPRRQLAAVVRAYLEYASSHPVVYEAMFGSDLGLSMSKEGTPAVELEATYAELRILVAQLPTVRPAEVATMTELLASSLHGLAWLERTHRLDPRLSNERVDRLIERFMA